MDVVGTVYIRADGSVEPLSAPLLKQGETYILTENLTCGGIAVERDNVTFDGNGYWLQEVQGSSSYSYGVLLHGIRNVTVRDSRIAGFFDGVFIWESLGCQVVCNNFTDCYEGVHLDTASNNSIIDNAMNLSSYGGYGLYIIASSGNIFINNNITWMNLHGSGGIENEYGSDNTMTQNAVSGGHWGINIFSGSNVTMKGNKMIGNEISFNLENPFDDMHVDSSNMIDDKRIYYWTGEANKTIPLDAGSVFLVNCTDITIQNLNITHVGQGIAIANATGIRIANNTMIDVLSSVHLSSSSNTTISENSFDGTSYNTCIILHYSNYTDIIDNFINRSGYHGIELEGSCFNKINENNISYCGLYAIKISDGSNNNTVYGNSIKIADIGMIFDSSHFNTICGNNITETDDGSMGFISSSNNLIFQNSILGGADFLVQCPQSNNTWNDNYPSGGNYWRDYTGADLYSGPYQNETGSDGFGDTPYVIDGNNVDHYPLMAQYAIPEFPSFLVAPIFMIATLLAIVVYKRRILTTAL